jgi:hypothetical protein
MIDDVLSRIFAQEWIALLVVAALLVALGAAGFRLGLRLYTAKDEVRSKQIDGIQSAVLSLLALLLGFTLAMAVGRYETRRNLVVKEANAVGTTYLRASLLPDVYQSPVQDALRRYVAVRLKYAPLVDDPAKLAEGMRSSAAIEAELWKLATAAAKEAQNNITGTFIVSLNEMIDTDAERVAAMRAQVPSGVLLVLLIVAGFGCVTTGLGAGAQGVYTMLGNVFLPLLYSLVIVLIFDLAHPRAGIIDISQQMLVDVQQSMQPVHP